MYIGQINQYALIFAIEFFLYNLPQTMRGNICNDIVRMIIRSRLVLNQLQRLFILSRLPSTNHVSNDAMHAHFEIFQYSGKRIKILHFSRGERLREFGKSGIDERSASILPYNWCSALMLCNPGEHK